MKQRPGNRLLARLLTAGLLVGMTACASHPELAAKSGVVPAGVDLSGLWHLDQGDADSARRIEEAASKAAGGQQGILAVPERKGSKSSRHRSAGSLVHVFLETGSELKVTQTGHGIFISFDRAVVEEYRFGEKREVSVGPVVAQRVSGWEGTTYAIETLDEDGALMTETYRLTDGGDTLARTISIVYRDVSQLDVQQRFRRSR
jgi:hypothetical protein